MHILLVAHQTRKAGAGIAMLSLIDALSDRCTFSVLLPEPEGFVKDELDKRGIKTYYAPLRRWAHEKNGKFTAKKLCWKLFWKRNNEKLLARLADEMKDEHFNIVHSNTSVINYGERLSRLLGVPHLWHIREYGEKDFNIEPLVSYQEYFQTFRCSRGLLCCISKGVAEKFSRVLPEEMVHVVYDGVGENNLIPDKQYKKEGTLLLVQAGNINKFKGQKYGIEAVQELYKRGITDVRLMICGRGDLSRIGLDISKLHNVEMSGVVSDMPSLRRDADIEIVASRCEGFGLVTAEAMMGGNPVVGSRSGATAELVDDGETGLLFEQGNSSELADKLEYLYKNRSEIERLGRNAALKARSCFTAGKNAEGVWRLYCRLKEEPEQTEKVMDNR